MKTLPLGPFLGINNRLPDFALHVEKVGDYLRAADNVDIDNAGTLRRRRAAALLVPMTSDAPHSLYRLSPTDYLLVRSSILYAITLPAYAQTLIKALASNAPTRYVRIGDDVYFSNGTDAGRVTAGAVYPLGLPTPDAPTIAVIGGTMGKGNYQVAFAYANAATGEEGGASKAKQIELPVAGGLRVTLPGAAAGATHVNVYLSACNGSQCYLAATVAAATSSVDLVTTVATDARAAAQRFEMPLPAGDLFVSNGRLCSIVNAATDHRVYVGLPYRHGYCLAVEGFIPFPAPISLGAEAQGGTYVCADKTYWIPGDLADGQGQIADVLPYGAVPGTVFSIPDSPLIGWFGAMGLVLADTQGQAKSVMNDAIDLTAPASGASIVFQTGGYMRVVSCGWCVNLETKRATRYLDWEFTSVAGNYGTKADGIYALDAEGHADASVSFGKLDFGSEQIKSLPYVYAGVASETPMELTVGYVDERGKAQSYTYPARSCSDQLTVQRFDVGKGVRAGWFDLTISNSDGSDFSLSSISFAPAASTRRI